MRINLQKGFFSSEKKEFISFGNMKITAFRYSTGVEALTVENPLGYFTLLPFQGQIIWDIHFCGKDLGMKTTIKEPVNTLEYLKNYGGFLYHCGVSAFGVPQKDDNHPQHGETPNIEYKNAYVVCDSDQKGNFIEVGGILDYDVAYVRKYQFRPSLRLYENSSVIEIYIDIENMRHIPMEYMYLCHINFRPFDGSELIYSAPCTKNEIKVYDGVPASLPKEYADKILSYIRKLEENPALHNVVDSKTQVYDPEICFGVNYKGDENNTAYTLQYKRGEGACYVSHPVDILPKAIRWIARTELEDSMGMVLPATAEHLGYQNAKRKGQVKLIGPRETLSFKIEVGYISDEMAKKVEEKINCIMK